jgi:DNA-binding NtrC family response regulator
LLITESAELVEDVSRIGSEIRDLRIETCSEDQEASVCLGRKDVGLALFHLTPVNETAVMRLLPMARAAGHAAAVLADPDCAPRRSAALDAGATDFLQLPADLEQLPSVLSGVTAPPTPPKHHPVTNLLGSTPADPFFGILAPEMVELMEQVRRVAPQDTTLLFTGETGTGKTRLARLVHEFSPRRDKPFLVVDCGALSPNLIESEMFGHVRGAFSGADRDRVGKLAAAGAGTLLLDEINSLPLELQGKLLRAVDERVFEPVGSNKREPLRARLIAVSNSPLEREVEAGRFRSDLYYRLNVVGFYLPPLCDRRSAIAPLAGQFLAEFAARNRPEVCGLSAQAIQALEAYRWPGNVRELRNVIERAVALCPGPEVQLRDLPEAVRGAIGRPTTVSPRLPAPIPAPAPVPPMTLAQTREDTEIRRIKDTLIKHRNNRRRTAAELGISPQALYTKLHKYGLMNAT